MIERVGFLDVTGGFANYKGQLHFPVGLFAVTGNHHIIIRADDGTGGLKENDRLRGQLHAAFLGMFLVVEPNANELAGPGRGRSQPFLHAKPGQVALRFQPLGQSHGAVCAEKGFAKILAKSADVYARTVFTEHTGFFLAGLADSNQFHDMSLTNVQGAAIHGVGATGDKRGFVAA